VSGRAPLRRGLGAEGLVRLADQLSARDLRVLKSVGENRFLTTNHLERLHFSDHASSLSGSRSCRRVLRRLHELKLLSSLPRRVGGFGAGSGSSIWFLSAAGKRILALRRGDGTALSAARVREPSVRFVAHSLGIADVRVRLAEAARVGAFGLAGVEIEPDCWRQYLGAHAVRETLKPDLAVTTTSPDGEFEDRWFVEVDLGTEHLPTVIRKCQQYETYRRTGDEQHRHGVFPIVVWLTRDVLRAEKISAAIRAARSLDRLLYRVVTTEQLVGLVAGGAS